MTDTTPNLALPKIIAAQAQKHVTHNEALRALDVLTQLAVLDRDLAAPPLSPEEGDRYLVAASPSGAWSGKATKIAAWVDGNWEFYAPNSGWLAYVVDEGALLAFDGAAWTDALSALSSLNNMTLLGVGTAADATNPFAAKLNNTLWTAKTVAEGGDGTLRYKLSKESAAKTLSFLFQDNFSGRAEIGLTGDDDFHFKVSADGTTWREGIVIDRSTGAVSFPNTTIAGGREILAANRTYYVRSDGSNSNTGLSNTSGGAFLTIQKAYDVIAGNLDLGGFSITVQIADGTYTAGFNVAVPWVGAGNVTFQGNSGTPANVLVSTTNASAFTVGVPLPGDLTVKDLKITTTTGGISLFAKTGGVLKFGNINFGACAQYHLAVEGRGAIYATGSYAITGGAQGHFRGFLAGVIDVRAVTVTLTGTPAFSAAFASFIVGSVAMLQSITFSGSATGKRYDIQTNSIVETFGGGANYLPGNVAGTTSTGGQYE